MTYVKGGRGRQSALSSMERYDASTSQWRAVANDDMNTARDKIDACVIGKRRESVR
jgi:hypothetical protein